MVFCQSCGMPLTPETVGTNADGSWSKDYCIYCFKDGKFLQDCTMDEMIGHCAQFVDEVNKGLPQPITKEEYIDQMKKYFPLLKRWRKPLAVEMETERLFLRPWSESDAEALFKYASDPEVGPRAGWPPHQSVEDSLEVIRKLFLNDHTWAIVLKETGEIIGCVGYHTASMSNLTIGENQCEVGFWIARPYWNQGICTEALQLVVGHCYQEKEIPVLWGSFFVTNPASGRVMEKCGFVDTGEQTLCPNLEVGSDQPVKVMKLTPSE